MEGNNNRKDNDRRGWKTMGSPKESKKEKPAPEEHSHNKVWRGSPRAWERCMFCELKKNCNSAGVERGSSACIDARYALVKGT
jgi:hypothetical protein